MTYTDTPTIEATDETLQEDAEALQRIMLRISWAAQRRLARDLDGFHLTLPQYMALRGLYKACSAGCTMSDLAERSHQLMPTMTGIIDRLEERGLVERRRDTTDRRILRVWLAPAGQALLERINAHNQARMQQTLQNLSAEERRQAVWVMQRYLEAVLSEIEADTPEEISH